MVGSRRRRGIRLVLGTVGVLWLVSFPATTEAAPPIVDRDYTIDLYQGSASGSPRTIGMGGTVTALAVGAAGSMGNPAAAAMRPQSARSRWDWDFNFDGFVPSLGSDFDNNGEPNTSALSARVGSGQFLGFWREWGVGIGYSKVHYGIDSAGNEDPVELEAAISRFIVARTLFDEALAVGVSVRSGDLTARGASDETIFTAGGASLEAGLIASPPGASFRWGARFALPVHGSKVESACDPLNCRGYILPLRAQAPWEAAVGGAYRFGQSPWNRVTSQRFSDEKAFTAGVDLLLTGSVSNGAGIGAFAEKMLQASGQSVVVSLRAGAEWEVSPGRFRLRAGTYWEPSRFAGIRGRLHATAGAETRLFSFHFWGAERRVAASLAIDAARRYGNVGLSFGFWN